MYLLCVPLSTKRWLMSVYGILIKLPFIIYVWGLKKCIQFLAEDQEKYINIQPLREVGVDLACGRVHTIHSCQRCRTHNMWLRNELDT